ncbi:hypothetical protein GOQ27_09625 [Clostridium sp. D2Q-11]|uniref:ABC exporter n=1 Tax=Anaeromonas frigoriresistens TaxID=2683708 RepID=A0A942UUA7_9FIRM|nr:putative ABC exporter domain-containing protein [Anaeromonas frigoriresistens]MBS4538723.1 hypothetical protein [Anaeromonas frigoriresistens]
MKLLLKRDLWAIKNHIVEIKRNPKRLIIYLLYILWIGSLVFNSIIANDNAGGFDIPRQNAIEYISAGYFVLISILFIYNLIKGLHESSTFFNVGDINFLFPAPVSSKKILLYNIIRKTLLNLILVGFIVIGVLPLIIQMVEIEIEYLPYLYMSLVGFALTLEPLKFALFALSTRYNKKTLINNIVYLLLSIFIGFILIGTFREGNLLSNILDTLNDSRLDYIPILGWSRQAFLIPIVGYSFTRMLYTILIYLAVIILIFLAYILGDDYYEDVADITREREAKKRRKKGLDKGNNKIKFFNKKGNINVKGRKNGVWSLLWKSKVEYKRSDIHEYLSITSLAFLALGIGIGLYTQFRSGGFLIPTLTGGLAYFMFLMSARRARDSELSKPYIYLIPGSFISKILAISSLDFIRMMINGALLYVPLILITDLPFMNGFIYWLFLISFYGLNLASNFLIRVLFPDSLDKKALFPLFLMLQTIVLLIPGFIIGGILAAIFGGVLYMYLGFFISNAILISVFIFLSNRVFEKLEWR